MTILTGIGVFCVLAVIILVFAAAMLDPYDINEETERDRARKGWNNDK